MSDDHAFGEMSCYGNRILSTPHLDRLAGEGARFVNAFVTNSLCAPARATVLTGTYSHINGVRGNSEGKDMIEHLNPELPTFPELLQQAGYRVALVGKWHLMDEPRGFDYTCILPGQGKYFDPVLIENGVRKQFKGYCTDIITHIALNWLKDTADDSRPFCLLYHHKAPHRPFKPAPRHQNLFADIELPYPRIFNDDYATRKIAAQAEDMRIEVSLARDYPEMPKGLSRQQKKEWIYQRFVKDHYRAVVGIDENVGRVLNYLDQAGLSENTAVFYTSDNGFFLGEHGWYDKRFMYEPSLRVPLLIRYPRLVKKPLTISEMVVNVDYAPTILDLAGVEVPEQIQGSSLRPLLENRQPANWRSSIYYEYFENSWLLAQKDPSALTDPSFKYFTPHRVGPHRGVRTHRYKLIEYYSEGDYWELFDLQEDPDELRNVSGDPAYREVATALKQELFELRMKYRAL